MPQTNRTRPKGPKPFNPKSDACQLVCYRMTKSVPHADLWAGDELIVEPSGRIADGSLHVIDYGDGAMRIDFVFVVDPAHIRVGEDPENIEQVRDVKIVGPVTGIARMCERSDAAPAIPSSQLQQSESDPEWPDEIDC